MNKKLLLFFIPTIFFCSDLFSQSRVDTSAIKRQLEVIRDRDQKTRKGIDSAAFMQFIDSTNLVQVESLISMYGWLGISFVGARGNNTIFLVIQHSDLATQEKYLPIMQKSVDLGESRSSDFALLHDRVLMGQGRKQNYGSQVVFDKMGNKIFYPIEDEKNVNIRRAKVGLEPIEEYVKYFGIDYKLPKQ
ncbi:MAG: hypothetical protein IPH93_16230 [Saprospiraceae bacterium]|nr:hypothetical protein [Saprospiraceae bacterium]MBK9632251.1 hypothetical protein [Saprospiraceae bacterium]